MTPAPPRVTDDDRYWTQPPPQRSPRCEWWLARIRDGWRPNKRILTMGYAIAAPYFGVYTWEYLHVISPALDAARAADKTTKPPSP